MQQFLLFCTMLIITSEAFSEELHGSQIFKNTARKTRIAPKLKFYNADMFGHLKFPMFSVPSGHKRPDYKAPFFVPTRRRRFEPKKYDFAPNNKGFNMRKGFRKKIFKQRKRNPTSSLIKPDSFVINFPQCFSTSWLLNPGCRVGPQNNFSNFFGSVYDSRWGAASIRNPNQFIVCLYPVFNHLNKRTLNLLTKRKFSALKRQCLTDLKDKVVKNKRSATKTMSFVNENPSQTEEKKVARSENQPKNVHENFYENHERRNENLIQNRHENFHKNFYENHQNFHERLYKNLQENCNTKLRENHNENVHKNLYNNPENHREHLYEKLNNNNNNVENLVSPKPVVASSINYNFNIPNYEILPKKENAGVRYQKEKIETKKILDSPFDLNRNSNEKLQDFNENSFSAFSSGSSHHEDVVTHTPDVAIKHPNEVNFYESPLRKEDDCTPSPFKEQSSNAVDENLNKESEGETETETETGTEAEAEAETSTHYSISKLKKILEQVESLLDDRSGDKVNIYGLDDGDDEDYKKPKKEKEKKKEVKVEKTVVTETVTAPSDAASIKKKIDTQALPILEELSQELGNISSYLATITVEGTKTITSNTKTSSSEKIKPKDQKKGGGKVQTKVKGKVKEVKETGKDTKDKTEGKTTKKGKDKVTTKEKTITKEKTSTKEKVVKDKEKGKTKEIVVKEQLKDHCSADGTWISTVLGFQMTFTTMPNMMLKVEINSDPDSIINKRWSIHGLSLSKRGGPFMLGAVYPQKRKLASFIGQCKICKNQDLIFGVWTIYTCGRRFTDIWRAVETKLDILRKES